MGISGQDCVPEAIDRRTSPLLLLPLRRRGAKWVLAVLLFISTLAFLHSNQTSYDRSQTVKKVQKCSVDKLHRDLSFLDSARPIQASEFIQRRDRLAQALQREQVDAFALEPGYTFQYYGNISQTDWEPWEPEERPFLMIVQPQLVDGEVKAKTSFLSPHFEEGRVRMLGIPAHGELDIVVWGEHWDPYATLRDGLFAGAEGVKIMVDEEMRDYIVRGLASAGFETVGLRGEVEAVRQIKSDTEIELIRAVNTGTVEAIRAMRPCLVPGLIEDEVTEILNNAMLSVGFSLFFNIVLFEENGALPHGGFVTGGKVLKESSVVLIDVGAHYMGYSSDVCRSFFIPSSSEKPSFITSICRLVGGRCDVPATREDKHDDLHAEKLKVWKIVLDAQTAAANMFKPNMTAGSVDVAARSVISEAGYGQYFTHRVGHGIGIKAHESPYLNKGNIKSLLRPGMTFTNEPGIYLTGRFGVRHEDIYLVKEEGEAELLSGRRATSPWDP